MFRLWNPTTLCYVLHCIGSIKKLDGTKIKGVPAKVHIKCPEIPGLREKLTQLQISSSKRKPAHSPGMVMGMDMSTGMGMPPAAQHSQYPPPPSQPQHGVTNPYRNQQQFSGRKRSRDRSLPRGRGHGRGRGGGFAQHQHRNNRNGENDRQNSEKPKKHGGLFDDEDDEEEVAYGDDHQEEEGQPPSSSSRGRGRDGGGYGQDDQWNSGTSLHYIN